MSQAIRKLLNGDAIAQLEKLFKDGNRDISLKLLLESANKDILDYLNTKNWGKRKKQAFMDAYGDIMTSIDSGTITGRDVSRKYVDSSGRIKNSEGRGFDAYGEAAHFLDTIVDALPNYTNQVETTPKKDKYNKNGLYEYFLKRTFGGNDPDLLVWQDRDKIIDEKTGKRELTNRANYFADIIRDYSAELQNKDFDFEGSAYQNKEDLLSRLLTAENDLRNNEFNNSDYNSLIALGLDGELARSLFNENSVLEANKQEPLTEEELYLVDAQLRQKEEELKLQVERLKKDEQLKEELTREYIIPALNFKERELALPTVNYNSVDWGLALDKVGKEGQLKFYLELENYLATKNPFDNQSLNIYNSVLKSNVPYLQHIANNLYTLKDKVGIDAGDGYYYLPYTINKENGTVLLYNPSTNKLLQRAISKVPSLWNKIQDERRSEYMSSTFNFGDGGIIKFLNGGYYSILNLDFVMDDYRKYKNELDRRQEEELNISAQKNKRTPELEKAGQRVVTEWSGVEKARLGAAAADVASIVAAFVPGYGTAASAALGVGSTLTNLGADIADESVSGGEAAWNTLAGLGMDLVGLVPGFGAAGKTGKIAKNLIKLTPKLLTLWGASLAYAPAVEALKKLTSDKELTVDDWKALSLGLNAVAGLSRMGAASMKARAYKNATKTGDKTIRVKSGKFKRISERLLNELKGKKTLEEANKYLKSLKGFENDELDYTFNRGKNPLKAQFYHTPKTGEHYNFDFYKTTKVGKESFGDSLDEKIYQSAVNSKIGFSIPGIKIPSWINPYRINKSEPYTPEKPKQIKGLLNTPRYYRLKEKGFTDELLKRRGIYRKGGQIPKALKGMRNVIGNENLSWENNIYNSEGFWNTLKRINKDNLSTYNNMLNTYSTLGFTDQMPGDGLTFNQNVADYLKLFLDNTDINNSTMLDLVKQGLITGRGNSSDKGVEWTPDGLAGTQTWLRHLGTKAVSPDLLAKINSVLKSNGVEAYINNDTGMVNFRVIPDTSSIASLNRTNLSDTYTRPTPVITDTKRVPVLEDVTSKLQGRTRNSIDWSKLGTFTPEFLSIGRLAGNIINNNRVTEETLKGLKPLLLDTYNVLKSIVGDLPTKQAYYNKAALIESVASRPRVSDPSLLLLSELEGTTKGNELRLQGDLAFNSGVLKSAELAWQVEADNMARRTNVANRNRASMLGIDKAKLDIEAARKSANLVSLENFLKEKEYKALNNLERLKGFSLQLLQDSLERELLNDPTYKNLYRLATSDNATLLQINDFYNYSELLGLKLREKLNKGYAKIYGLRYPILSAKNGASVPVAKIRAKTDSAKLFLETIKDTVKSHLHMIDNLSSVTKELIIKSMTL